MKKKLNVKDMVMLAMFIALTVGLGWINQFFPSMPQGGTVSIDIVAIFLCAYLMGTGYGVICGIGVSILQFVLGMAVYYGPWSVLLDYVLPLAVCGLAPLVKTTRIGQVPIYWGVIFSMILKFICHFLSGAFLFAQPGVNPYIYSLTYNLPYNLATLVVCMILVTILCERLKKAWSSIYH